MTALNRGQPDRVPTMEWVLHPDVISRVNGSESALSFVSSAGLDGIAVSLNYRTTVLDSRHVIDEWGVTRVTYDEYPNPVAFPVKDADDLRKLAIPDPDDEYRYQALRRALNEVGDEIAVVARVKDVFSQPRDLMGFEDFLMAFYLQPDLVAELMQMCVDHSTKVARNLKSIGIEVIVIGDDIANNQGLLISPEMYMEQVYPSFQELVRNFKDLDLLVIKHSDGDLRAVVEPLIETGIDCLDPIDPLGNMDIAQMKQKYGSRVALKGNVDCVGTLVDGTREDVVRATMQCILAASIGGGHIISSSNSIHSGISPENYRVFLDTVHEYGTYPLDMTELQRKTGVE